LTTDARTKDDIHNFYERHATVWMLMTHRLLGLSDWPDAQPPHEYWLWLQLAQYEDEDGFADDEEQPTLFCIFSVEDDARAASGWVVEQQKVGGRPTESNHGMDAGVGEWGFASDENYRMPCRLWAAIQARGAGGTFAMLEDSLRLIRGYDSLDEGRQALQSSLQSPGA
jgi:hypothetical protein